VTCSSRCRDPGRRAAVTRHDRRRKGRYRDLVWHRRAEKGSRSPGNTSTSPRTMRRGAGTGRSARSLRTVVRYGGQRPHEPARARGEEHRDRARTGQLYVNIGAPSNSCQVQNRAPESPGQDPVPFSTLRAHLAVDPKHGRSDAGTTDSATRPGLRNAVALAVDPGTGSISRRSMARYAVCQLAKLYTEGAERLAGRPRWCSSWRPGGDYGWRSANYDWRRRQNVMNPSTA